MKYQETMNVDIYNVSSKYNFQGQSSRSRRWLDLYHERLEENLWTRETDLYRKLYQNKFRGDDTKSYQIF